MNTEVLKHPNASDNPATHADQVGSEIVKVFESSYNLFVGYRINQGSDQPEDTVQESFLRAWKHRDRFMNMSENYSSLAPWVRAIGNNVERDLARKNAARQKNLGEQVIFDLDKEDIPDSSESADYDLVLSNICVDSLLEKLEPLPDNYKQALFSQADGLSWEEIGKRMGTTTGAAKAIGYRARREARELLRSS